MNNSSKTCGKLTIPLLVLLTISFSAPAQAKYGGGTGGPNDPYLIFDANQMNAIGANADDLDKHFILMADIDLAGFTGTEFNIIGSYGNPFTGVFDGNGHTISNFSYTSIGTSHVALFAYVSGENVEIKNLGLLDPNVNSGTRDYAGSLVSQLSGATINNCYVQGGSVSGAMNIGGLVGNNDGTITNSYAASSVSGSVYVGGLVGSNGGTISNCYATGSASGGNVVGGLAGYNDGRFREGTITNCYSAASVSGGQYLGGLLGYNQQGETANSFWDIETSGQATSAGGTGKTTAEMKTASTFATWACDYSWTIDEGQDYPRLVWQNAPGETIAALLLGGGTGTQADPYLIYTAEQLNMIGLLPCDWDKHFLLMADIDLASFTGTVFNIIGSYDNPFTGTFDGNGHIISNFSYTSTEGDNIGLFGCIDGPDAEIKDLGLIAPDVDGGTGDCLGSLVGYVKDGTITACYAEDGSVSGHYGGGPSYYTFYPISPNLRNISYTGTSVILSDDQVSNAIHLPFNFNFNFYDTQVSEVYISSNGFITFLSGQSQGCCSGRPMPTSGSPDAVIAAFWTDLYPPGGGTIRYQTLGSVGSRQFVIGFYQVPHCCGTSYPVTFEIILHEGTNNIELQYGSAPSSGRTNSAGIENFDGTDGLQVAYGNVSFDNEAFLITALSGSRNVGALVGQNEGTIFNSYATSAVSGVDGIGGLVGGSSGPISDCYSTGSVSGDYRTGGLAGYNDGGEVTGSFWDIQTSGQYSSAGGTGKTTAQMQDPNTFMDAGWNFVGKPDGPSDIWAEPAGGGYPILWWQLSPLPELPTFSGGSGTADDPYLISTAAELNSISYNPRLMKAHFKLINDIDLTGVDFYIIGSRDYPYSGVFDGNDHTISNFTYTSTGTSHIALFGYVRGVIKDLGLLDPDVDAPAGEYVASLVGQLSSGTITNCYVQGGSVSGAMNIGGLVGYNYRGTITDCYATGEVTGSEMMIGGLMGLNEWGTITNCYATGSVSQTGIYGIVGGLVGYNAMGTVTNSYATGSVSGNMYVGGLAGANEGTISKCYADSDSISGNEFVGGLVGYNFGTTTNSYSTGSVTGSYEVGGLVGYNNDGTISNCYSEGDVSGYYYLGGLVGYNYTSIYNYEGTITNCYSEGDVSGNQYVGGLVGYNYSSSQMGDKLDTITSSYSEGDVSGDYNVGGLVGYNSGPITNCYSEGSVSGDYNAGGLVGYNESFASVSLDHTLTPIQNNLRNIRLTGTPVSLYDDQVSGAIPLPFNFNFNFYGTQVSELFISSNGFITFLSGQGSGCCSGQPLPYPYTPNGLIAGFWTDLYPPGGGTIRYQTLGSEGSRQFVIGFYNVPHCCGTNYYPVTFEIILHEGTNNIELQYGSAPSPGYTTSVGIENFDGTDGLQVAYGWDVSFNYEGFLITPEGEPEMIGGVSRCYSTGSVLGTTNVGGLLGDNVGTVYLSFWDTETSGQTDSDGGTGKTTDEMQTASTFTDARWDFNTPVWTIDEGVDYPHLWWELAPLLHAELEITLWTSNTISWDPLPGASEYYAECAEDANFTSILYNSGWITDTSCEFTGLQLGKRYWYSVKARNTAGVETGWSNVESSLQLTLDDAVEILLDPKSLKNKNMKKALLNKINAVQKMIADGLYAEALDKLRNDILQKTDGCVLIGQPDRNDWIKTCEAQSRIYPLIIEAIENVIGLMDIMDMEQSPERLRTATGSSGDTRRVTLPLRR